MNLIKAITFLLCSTLLVGQTVPLRNPQIQGASGAIISGATLTNSGTFVNSGTINGAGTFNLGSGTVTLPASSVTSGNITDGAIINADINASAAIDISKLASSAITIAGTSTSLGGSITASAILDSISSTQGTILYRGASGWAALSPGTSGHFLKTQGAGANPMWDAAAGSGSVATDAIWDAAGDLAVGTGANTAARLAIGTSGHVLTSNGTTAAWAAPTGGAFSTLSDVDLTGIASGDMLKWNGTDWINRTAANVRTDLGLGTLATQNGTISDYLTAANPTAYGEFNLSDSGTGNTWQFTPGSHYFKFIDGTGGPAVQFNITALTTDRSITVPDASGTMAVSASGNIALSAVGNITFTGNLPVTNLNSGTSASSTTFWRGDGTWAGAQPLATILTTLSGLANAAGVLTNNGSGTLSYTGTTTGGNGTGDSGKVVIFNANGGISLGKNDQTNTPLTIAISSGYGTVVTVEDFIGFGHYVELKGSDSVGFHTHVPGSSTGNHQGFTADMSGGTGINYGYQATVPSNGLVFLGSEYVNPLTSPRIAITATGDIHRYLNGTSFTAGTDKTILTFANPSGTKTITFPATTGTAVVTSSGAVALTTDTTGNYVADVAGTSNEITSTHTPGEGSTATLSLPATIDLGGKTSFEIPNGAAPTVDAFGEIAGDNDLWAASRGAPVFFDGTAATALVNVLVSDTPSNGQVPTWNTGGTITWEAAGSGAVATDTIWDAKGDLAGGTGSNTAARLAVGTNGYVLTADSAETTGMKWAAASGSGASSVWIGAGEWIPRTTNGVGVDSGETVTNDNNFDYLTFDAGATSEGAQVTLTLPDNYAGGTVTATFYWTASSGSGTVIWKCAGRSLEDDLALDTAAGTAQSVTDTLITAEDMHISSATGAITIAGTPAAHTPIIFTITRDSATDTLAVDARLIGVEINY